jgi:hypothetical protein
MARWISNFPSFFGYTFVILGRQGDPILVTNSVMHSEPMHTEVLVRLIPGWTGKRRDEAAGK